MNKVRKTRDYERALAAIKFVSVDKSISTADKLKQLLQLQDEITLMLKGVSLEEDNNDRK